MADIYVKSGATTPTSPYNTSWDTAAQLIATAAGIDAAGDTYYVSNNHNEASSTAQTVALAGTIGNPNKLICVSDSVFPAVTPVSIPTGIIATTGATAFSISGSGYFYGLIFNIGSASASQASFNLSTADNSHQVFEGCAISLGTTSTTSRINIGSGAAATEGSVVLKNTTVKFANASQSITIAANGRLIMIGGGIDNASTALTSFINTSGGQVYAEFRGVDISKMTTGSSLISSPINTVGDIKFINCKLPAGWTGVPITTVTHANMRVSLYNCDNAATNYRLWITTSAGSIKESTTVVKTGGASDGTTAISWKMVTGSSNEAVNQLISDPIAIWVDTTGSSKTATIDFIHDSVTSLNDSEVWVEAEYLGSTTIPLGSYLSDRRLTLISGTTTHSTSSATWTTTGLTSPNKQKLDITVTPNMKGFIYLRVYLAKPSYTIYVDPKVTVV